MVNIVLEQVELVHDCGVSPACPALKCLDLVDSLKMMDRVEELTIELNRLKIEEARVEPEEVDTAVLDEVAISTLVVRTGKLTISEEMPSKNPIKFFIQKFEEKCSNWKAQGFQPAVKFVSPRIQNISS